MNFSIPLKLHFSLTKWNIWNITRESETSETLYLILDHGNFLNNIDSLKSSTTVKIFSASPKLMPFPPYYILLKTLVEFF